MIVSDFTQVEIDYLLAKCNFTESEKTLFKERARNKPIEIIAEEMQISISTAWRLSQKVNKKIIRIL